MNERDQFFDDLEEMFAPSFAAPSVLRNQRTRRRQFLGVLAPASVFRTIGVHAQQLAEEQAERRRFLNQQRQQFTFKPTPEQISAMNPNLGFIDQGPQK